MNQPQNGTGNDSSADKERQIFSNFSGIEEGGVKTVNFSSSPGECRVICESGKLDKTVCKHGSSCHVRTNCKVRGHPLIT